jgi:virginiamycin B lyase
MRRFFLSKALLALLLAQRAPAITITRYPSEMASAPVSIAASAHGEIWVASPSDCSAVGFDAQTAAFVQAKIFTGGKCPTFLVAAPDGYIWATQAAVNLVRRWTVDSEIEEFTPLTAGAAPYDITFGPDGAAWFTEYNVGRVGRINAWGVVSRSEVTLATPTGHPAGVTIGGGMIWVAESTADQIARFAPGNGGDRMNYGLPAGSFPWMICAGPDDAVYFTERNRNRIARLSFDLWEFDVFVVPTSNSGVDSIALGPDGNLWFTEFTANKIGRMTPSGQFTEWPLPAGAHPKGITADSRGHVWFVESGTSTLAQITFAAPADVNWDGIVNVIDVFYLINFLFAGGPPPAP